MICDGVNVMLVIFTFPDTYVRLGRPGRSNFFLIFTILPRLEINHDPTMVTWMPVEHTNTMLSQLPEMKYPGHN